jgi:hypothetical protein
MSRRVTAQMTPMSSGRLPQVSCHPDLESVIPERTSGRNHTSDGAYPIKHHVAEPVGFEHPDKAGHPRVATSVILPDTRRHP